jgi:PhnB protein
MSKRKQQLTPDGCHTVTPRIVTHHAKKLVEFLKKVFDASGEYRSDRPAVVKVGDSVIMISDAGVRNAAPSFLYVYVADADATYERALQAGSKSLEEPTETPYGDRRAMVEDPWGNTWQIAKYGRERRRQMSAGILPAIKK